MKIPFVDLHAQYLSIEPEIDAAIAAVIAESSFIRGPHVDTFEQEFAEAIGVSHCVSCANGTDALYIAMKGLGIQQGDEVITTAHSWISTSETITQAGGRVVFCDTDQHTFTIDPALIEAKITPRTVGIIPVHLFGQSADMEPIQKIAKKHNLWIVEDCAQAHLAKYKGQTVGTLGNAATFSFYPGKNLGAMGDAGCLVTNDTKLAEWAKLYARHGGKGDHQIEGINSRLDGLQAAILSAKLPHLAQWTNERQRVAKQYDKALAGIPGVEIPIVAENRTHVYHLYVIRCERRDELKTYLSEKGVSTVLNYPKALPFYSAYSYLGHNSKDFPQAFANQSRILSLPIFPEMTDQQISYVSEQIHRFYNTAS
jgi:dTDP-4-amino-4,6-dideoxygalactose transaminase